MERCGVLSDAGAGIGGRRFGWLSYIPSGLQELTLQFDDGVRWRSGPSYSRCGSTTARAEDYVTRESDALVREILAATRQKRAFDECGCVKHP